MAIDVELKRRRFTLDEYHQMIRAGILHEDDRVELIRGEIVQMTAIGSLHASCVAKLTDLLVGQLRGQAILWPQNPLTILPDSEPEPDIILLRYREDFYRHALPQPEDVALLVEVADTSLRYDRHVKGPLYSEAGVGEYWIVDLEGEAIEVYRQPHGDRYERVARLERGASITPEAFPELTLAVATILG